MAHNLDDSTFLEVSKEQLRESCVHDVDQLAELTKQLQQIIRKQESLLRAIDDHQQRILGVLRTEVQLAFTR
jgi:hypothetical protein